MVVQFYRHYSEKNRSDGEYNVYIKAQSGEILCKDISSHEDVDDELVGHPDSMYNDTNQQYRVQWLVSELKTDSTKRPIMEVGTACGYILDKIDGNIGTDIRPDRLLVAKRKYPNRRFCYANILNLEPFYNTGIKTIVAAEIFEHLPYDFVHYALIHCLKTAPLVYYTVPNSETDTNVAKNPEHKWCPTYNNLKGVLDYTAKQMNIVYDIKNSNNFFYGTIRRIRKTSFL